MIRKCFLEILEKLSQRSPIWKIRKTIGIITDTFIVIQSFISDIKNQFKEKQWFKKLKTYLKTKTVHYENSWRISEKPSCGIPEEIPWDIPEGMPNKQIQRKPSGKIPEASPVEISEEIHWKSP